MFEPLVQQPADNVALNPFDTDVQFAVRLLFWLDIEGVDTSSVKPQLSLLMDGFSQRLISTVGLDAKMSKQSHFRARPLGLESPHSVISSAQTSQPNLHMRCQCGVVNLNYSQRTRESITPTTPPILTPARTPISKSPPADRREQARESDERFIKHRKC
jgi:hypothetical protein